MVMNILIAVTRMIVASFDGCRTKDMVEVATVWLLVNPFSYGVEHVAMNLEVLIAESWMMKNTKDIIHHLVDRNSWVLPGIENSSGTELVYFHMNGG
jgi:hypothetical protein